MRLWDDLGHTIVATDPLEGLWFTVKTYGLCENQLSPLI